MDIDPFRVISHLLARFPRLPTSSDPISRHETKLSDHFYTILSQSAIYGIEIEEEEDLIMQDDQVDATVSLDDSEERRYQAGYTQEKTIRFSGSTRTAGEVEAAIQYRWSMANGNPRNHDSVKRRFRWLNSAYDWRKLLSLERANDISSDRLANLANFGNELKAIAYEKFEKGIILHDAQLKEIALSLRAKYALRDFQASDSWIDRFKRMARIVSRHITRMIIKKVAIDREKLEEECNDTVKIVRDFIAANPTVPVFNSDQCGVNLEIYSKRTLLIKGEKTVERIADSSSALTHSYTILPQLFSDGILGEKLFVVFAEKGGNFPPTVTVFSAPNLHIVAGKSHIMTKVHMFNWLQNCAFINSNPSSTYMIVDSWPSFRDHSAIKSAAAAAGHTVEILNLPAHSTSSIQPLDLHFNMQFKAVMKRICTYIMAFEIDFPMKTRNNRAKMLSLIYHQMKAPILKPSHQYAFKKAGFIDVTLPPNFPTPAQYLFPKDVVVTCEFPCPDMSFIRCAHCNKRLGWTCFVTKYHIC